MNESESNYVVKEGDTLSKIAEQHGTSVEDLISLNHIQDPNLLHPGQELRLPSSQAADPSAETKTPREQDNTQDAVLRESPM